MSRPGKKNMAYKILWPLVYVYFNVYFNPKKINELSFPKDGPIILCSNHMHTHDQFMALMQTRRVVHYMSKKEYFDGKFGFFFKSVGCIPVDRSIKDENAKNEAIEILNNGGAIGIFPEGTRNFYTCKTERLNTSYELYKDEMSKKEFKKTLANNKTRTAEIDLLDKLLNENKITKEEYKKYIINARASLKELCEKNIITKEEYDDTLLLPFKFGAVSMASKTNATIMPFAIEGDYKFRSKNLRVKYGVPFKVGDTPLEEANKHLRDEIKGLLLDIRNQNGKE